MIEATPTVVPISAAICGSSEFERAHHRLAGEAGNGQKGDGAGVGCASAGGGHEGLTCENGIIAAFFI